MASSTSANSSAERMEGMIRIVLPLARSSFRLPGVALLLLRVAWIEGHDFRAKRTEDFVSLANGSARKVLISETSRLFTNAQFEHAPR